MFENTTTKQYLSKKSYLNQRLQHDVLEGGTAYIPCRIESTDDVIDRFSVKGCEALNPEFMSYIINFIDVIPLEYPVVLEINGPKFSAEEKKIITETIEVEMDYLLGQTEESTRIRKKRFWIMIAGTIISGILLPIAQKITSSSYLEFFFVIFWLFADALVRYIFIEKMDFKDEKIRVGRLASMKVEFVEEDAEKDQTEKS